MPPSTQMGSRAFADRLRELLADDFDRGLGVRYESRLGGRYNAERGIYEPRTDTVHVEFVNLPRSIASRGAGGGAESENNRMSFDIEGFDRFNPEAPPPTGRVRIEHGVSAFPREFNLRAKTGDPERIANYLADHLRRVVREVPPRLTHSR